MRPYPPNFTLRQLAYLVAVSETGTIIGAAERMHVSASAMSEAITELERVLGAKLCVRRKSHGVTLTSAGTRTVSDARRLLRGAEELSVTLSSEGEQLAGPLAVGCFGPIAPTVLPALLGDFGASHPGLDIELVESTQDQLVEMLESARLDVAFVYDAFLPSGTPRIEVFALRPHVLLHASHRLADADQVRLEDLADDDFIMLNAPPTTDHALGIFAARGLTPRVRHRTANSDVVRTLVGHGLGYGMLIQPHPDYSHLTELPVVRREISPPVTPVSVALIWSSSLTLSNRGRAVIEFAQAVSWPLGKVAPPASPTHDPPSPPAGGEE
ncbi:LysR family transcriptional regulator [Kineococcus sp. LSe6-4]|uniref:LysR family transcriptional regulator n=1 Tax=Kineococcus halophytocola TaxID=3234027 RepID=A0ABV4H2X6_9ACTN